MAHRQINVSRGKFFITLLIIAIIMQVVPDRHTERLNILFLRVFHPVLNIRLPGFSRMIRPASSAEGTVPDSEFNRLYATYENTCAQLISVQQKYETLAGIRSGLPRLGAALVQAKVITPGANSFGHELLINEGEKAGIKPGQLVLSWNGSPTASWIIGSIREAHETTATVELLTRSGHTLMVNVLRQGKQEFTLERQMEGNGKEGGRIPLVARSQYDIRVGDTVFAAAQPGVLDTPIVIGEVAAVKPDEDNPLLWDIAVRPMFERKSVTDVAVIAMTPQETADP